MVDRDDHDIVLPGQLDAVIADEGAGAARIAAAVQPDHDRQLASGIQSRRPDIQDQTVLAHHLVAVHDLDFVRHETVKGGEQLRRALPVGGGLAYARPGFEGCGRLEATGARRCGGVGNSQERIDARRTGALDLPMRGADRCRCCGRVVRPHSADAGGQYTGRQCTHADETASVGNRGPLIRLSG